MNNDYTLEKLNSIRNEMSHFWGGIFITGGGAFTIISTASLNSTKVIITILGVIMMLVFINAYIMRRTELLNILQELKQENE